MTHPERSERIASDVERRHFNVLEEVIEFARLQYNARERFMAHAFAQHIATVQRDLRRLIAANEGEAFPKRFNIRAIHPLMSEMTISGRVTTYSTVGDLVPICRRRRLLKMSAASFFACKRAMLGQFHQYTPQSRI